MPADSASDQEAVRQRLRELALDPNTPPQAAVQAGRAFLDPRLEAAEEEDLEALYLRSPATFLSLSHAERQVLLDAPAADVRNLSDVVEIVGRLRFVDGPEPEEPEHELEPETGVSLLDQPKPWKPVSPERPSE